MFQVTMCLELHVSLYDCYFHTIRPKQNYQIVSSVSTESTIPFSFGSTLMFYFSS